MTKTTSDYSNTKLAVVVVVVWAQCQELTHSTRVPGYLILLVTNLRDSSEVARALR